LRKWGTYFASLGAMMGFSEVIVGFAAGLAVVGHAGYEFLKLFKLNVCVKR